MTSYTDLKVEEFKVIKIKKRASIAVSVRRYVFQRDNHQCRYCGKKSELNEKLEVDHIMPVSQGGDNSLSNLVLACYSCNKIKDAELNWKPIPLQLLCEVETNLLPLKCCTPPNSRANRFNKPIPIPKPKEQLSHEERYKGFDKRKRNSRKYGTWHRR